jgi:hypothetical protein
VKPSKAGLPFFVPFLCRGAMGLIAGVYQFIRNLGQLWKTGEVSFFP